MSLIRALACLFLLAGHFLPHARAADCPVPSYTPKAGDNMLEWHEKFIEPALRVTSPGVPRQLSREQLEMRIEQLSAVHRRGISDPLYFESLVQQISNRYANSMDFRGLDTTVAHSIYRAGSGDFDFTALCIDTRRARNSDDTFAITLFGVSNTDCNHASLRGIVFTSTLINGAENGQCRPDYVYTRMLVLKVPAGTNTVTFVCVKDANGCARR